MAFIFILKQIGSLSICDTQNVYLESSIVKPIQNSIGYLENLNDSL